MAREHKLETFKGKGKQPYRFRVKAPNGEVIYASEGYATRSSRNRAAHTYIANFRRPVLWVSL